MAAMEFLCAKPDGLKNKMCYKIDIIYGHYHTYELIKLHIVTIKTENNMTCLTTKRNKLAFSNPADPRGIT